VNDAVQGAVRGTVASLAMSGMRVFASDLGLVERTPPEELAAEPASGLMERVPPEHRRAAVGALHCAVGAVGGATYGVLPDIVRQKAWSGPIWGVAIWVTYEFGVAPVLGLKHARDVDVSEQATIVADHLLYGWILSETRRRPSY
jgi:hypothetical protein